MPQLDLTKSGFTLIELLVVISIIALLSSLLLVALQAARNAALDSVQTQADEQLRIAINSYFLDHNAYPPVPYAEDQFGNVMVGSPSVYGNDNFGAQLFPMLIAGNYISSSQASAFYKSSPQVDTFIYSHWCDSQTPCDPNNGGVQSYFAAFTQTCASRPIAFFAFTLRATNQFKVDCFY